MAIQSRVFRFKTRYIDELAFVTKSEYAEGGLALKVYSVDDKPLCTASVNLDEPPHFQSTLYDVCWIKTWSENEGVLECLKKEGLVKCRGPVYGVNQFGSVAVLVEVLF